MPFKSQAQRAMFYARGKDDPEWKARAEKWSEHTPKGKSLPKHVKEMPHFDSEPPFDLRIERYPVPDDVKEQLFNDFKKTGLVGKKDGKLLHFKPDHSVTPITPQQASQIPKLPDDWEKHAVTESRSPRMSEVFLRKAR